VLRRRLGRYSMENIMVAYSNCVDAVEAASAALAAGLKRLHATKSVEQRRQMSGKLAAGLMLRWSAPPPAASRTGVHARCGARPCNPWRDWRGACRVPMDVELGTRFETQRHTHMAFGRVLQPSAVSLERRCCGAVATLQSLWPCAAMTAQLVTDALVMAIWRRGKPDALLHHSDRGSQYTSEQFQRLMADNGVVCSMSRSGNVWDNAAMEGFVSSLKTERTARKLYRTRDEAKADMFDYIERFYNPKREQA
jgi:transposase InsO family protein